MKKIIFTSLLLLSLTDIYSQIFSQDCLKAGVFLPSMPACNEGNYYTLFEDNFDGNTLDLSKWQIQPWGQGALYGTGNSQEYNTLDNVEVSNGTCKIIAKHETVVRRAISYKPDDEILDDELPNLRTYHYTSANLWTIAEKFLLGKYEIRCRLPNGKGFWPAFWTYGGQRWNEIDVFDNLEGNNRFSCGPGYDFDGDGQAEGCRWGTNNIPDFSQWHTFTCIYDFDRIVWQIDGSTVRTLFRFSTVTGSSISCGEDIAIGTYFQEKSFPIDDMHIIINLAIRNGEEAPDANTIFPNTFEIDYVRFSIKSEQVPCDGCLDHIVYENTSHLPTLTRAKNYIQAGNNVTVQSGQTVALKAPVIKLLPGFSTEPGASFVATAEECNLLNYTDVSIDLIGSNAVDDYQIIKCINPIYTIDATGVLFYSFRAYNLSGQLVYSTSGTSTSNIINLWNAINVVTGWYPAHLELLNCSDSEIRDYNLLVSSGNCKMANTTTDSTNYASDYTENNELTDSSDISLENLSTLNKEFLIYPNPANDKLNIFYSLNDKCYVIITISDLNGKDIFQEVNISEKLGANKKTIDVSRYVNGTYILSIVANHEKIENKFVISK